MSYDALGVLQSLSTWTGSGDPSPAWYDLGQTARRPIFVVFRVVSATATGGTGCKITFGVEHSADGSTNGGLIARPSNHAHNSATDEFSLAASETMNGQFVACVWTTMKYIRPKVSITLNSATLAMQLEVLLSVAPVNVSQL